MPGESRKQHRDASGQIFNENKKQQWQRTVGGKNRFVLTARQIHRQASVERWKITRRTP
jgi:hypothetical protein